MARKTWLFVAAMLLVISGVVMAETTEPVWRTVRPGDTLESFARRFKTAPVDVLELNIVNLGSRRKHRLIVGEDLNVNTNSSAAYLNMFRWNFRGGDPAGPSLLPQYNAGRIDEVRETGVSQFVRQLRFLFGTNFKMSAGRAELSIKQQLACTVDTTSAVYGRLRMVISTSLPQFTTMTSTLDDPIVLWKLGYGGYEVERLASGQKVRSKYKIVDNAICLWRDRYTKRPEPVQKVLVYDWVDVPEEGYRYQLVLFLECQNVGILREEMPPPPPTIALNKVGPATVLTGETMSYTLRWSTAGRDSVTNAVVTDQLPAGVDFVSANPSGAFENGLVVWDLGTVPCGVSDTLGVTVKVAAGGGAILTNTAEFQTKEVGPVRAQAVTNVMAPPPLPPPPPMPVPPTKPVLVNRYYPYNCYMFATLEDVNIDPNGQPFADRHQDNLYAGHGHTYWGDIWRTWGLRYLLSGGLFDLENRSLDLSVGAVYAPILNDDYRLDFDLGAWGKQQDRGFYTPVQRADLTYDWRSRRTPISEIGPYAHAQLIGRWILLEGKLQYGHRFGSDLAQLTMRPGSWYFKAAWQEDFRGYVQKTVDNMPISFAADSMRMVEGRIGHDLGDWFTLYGAYDYWRYQSATYDFDRKGFGLGVEWYFLKRNRNIRADFKASRFHAHDVALWGSSQDGSGALQRHVSDNDLTRVLFSLVYAPSTRWTGMKKK